MAEIDRYNFSSWKEVEILLEPSGKAPKKYGEGVYRFGATLMLPVLMPRRGWGLVKKSKNYVYLKPNTPPPFILKIKIPTREQAIELAQSFYQDAESQHFQIGELPGTYLHREPGNHFIHIPGVGDKPHQHIPTTIPQSWLYIGEFGVWKMELKSFDGDWTTYEHGKILTNGVARPNDSLVNGLPPVFNGLPIVGSTTPESLVEGAALEVVQTKYERSPHARKQCIEHYGLSCQVCDFDFEKVYGKIGKGFIHVHHIVPVSQQGGEYTVDPIKDLIPLCPNCHAMVHVQDPPFTVAQLKSILSTISRYRIIIFKT